MNEDECIGGNPDEIAKTANGKYFDTRDIYDKLLAILLATKELITKSEN